MKWYVLRRCVRGCDIGCMEKVREKILKMKERFYRERGEGRTANTG